MTDARATLQAFYAKELDWHIQLKQEIKAGAKLNPDDIAGIVKGCQDMLDYVKATVEEGGPHEASRPASHPCPGEQQPEGSSLQFALTMSCALSVHLFGSLVCMAVAMSDSRWQVMSQGDEDAYQNYARDFLATYEVAAALPGHTPCTHDAHQNTALPGAHAMQSMHLGVPHTTGCARLTRGLSCVQYELKELNAGFADVGPRIDQIMQALVHTAAVAELVCMPAGGSHICLCFSSSQSRASSRTSPRPWCRTAQHTG